jgi:hypothetical protein
MSLPDLQIYGDSFGEEEPQAFHHSHAMYREYKNLLSYHTLLRDSGLFRSVTTFAVGGSDLWTQRELFLKNYTGTQLVLWFETHPGRLTSPCGLQMPNLNSAEHRLYEHREGFYKNAANNDHIVQVLDAACDFFTHLMNDDYESFAQREMVADIRNRCASALVLPCFDKSITFDPQTRRSLISAFITENNVFQDVWNRGHWDIRRNHMTEANHRILAQQLIDYYRSGQPPSLTGWVAPNPAERSKYFRAINHAA